MLYKKAESWDKAACVYIKTKSWLDNIYSYRFNSSLILLFRNNVGDIFARITSVKLIAQYAKAREADGHYKEAAKAYEAAQDYDNATRYISPIVHAW